MFDSPVGPAGAGWLGTLWPLGPECGWERMLWAVDGTSGGWVVPGRLGGGDVIEFGNDTADRMVRWYGIVDSYDAVEWLIIQGPYPEPWAAHQHGQQLLDALRYAPPLHTYSTRRACTRRPARRR